MIFSEHYKWAIPIILIFILTFAFFLFPRSSKESFDEIAIRRFIDNIKEPIEVIDTLFLKDGGTIYIQIKDSEEDYFNITLDQRLVVLDEKGKRVSERYLYLNASYPEKVGSIKVPIASSEEKEILMLFKDWRKNNLEYSEGDFLDMFIVKLESRQ